MTTLNTQKNILVIGASGLLGNAVLRTLSQDPALRVTGTLRSSALASRLLASAPCHLEYPVDVGNFEQLRGVIERTAPDVVINCVGATKHVDSGNDASVAYIVNAVLPHSLAALCSNASARLIHISTDCVYSGSRGLYSETDVPDANDVYGLSKAAGEVRYSHTVTLRTSIIGHEIETSRSLVEWFMRQRECRGFTRAIFSGFPTVTLSRIIRDLVIPNASLYGLYHVAAPAISKYDLLALIANQYGLRVKVEADNTFLLDRSLDGSRFAHATGFQSPSWPKLIAEMHTDWLANPNLFPVVPG
jgi:dTDP-4-dehydrorhamnose reductase